MAETKNEDTPPKVTRRGFLTRGAASGLSLALTGFPAIRISGRPEITSGVQSGDVSDTGAILWSRADRPARMLVEISPTERFTPGDTLRRIIGPAALENSDFTAKFRVTGLTPGTDIFYRVRFASLDSDRAESEPVIGRFRTAPSPNTPRRRVNRAVSFVWTGDTVGQGWGINEAWGGLRGYEAMRRLQPDFWINSGDCVYADGPLASEVKLPDGTVWKNRVTEEKSKVAETLNEFRGNFRYNLMDENYRRFMAETPVLAQWDDHETLNNWYPGEILDDDRYKVKSVSLLSARANQAFREYMPVAEFADEPGRVYRKIAYGPLLDIFMLDMRTYRGPNTTNNQDKPGPDTAFLGAEQMAWLERDLKASKALWKVFAADMPLGLIVPDGKEFEAVASGDGPPRGREFEIAALLRFLKTENIRNTVWLTADVHYAAAHHYDPDRALFKDFLPFWEFVAGPIHAGTFGPNKLDNTFGPQEVFRKDCGGTPNQPPSSLLQFFGHIRIAPDSGILTVALRDIGGTVLFTRDLSPEAK